ncbi:MAG: C-GCAxxG-C-C family protein [Spirochaetaceae bacterium]|jgi:C_GCAxxG_C_C family probable redox protein|nr:C-GCAxxG-C-C family protein [Spirochaetaceae bacterium]
MEKAELAKENFKDGCNCAQAVLCAYADDFFLDRKHAMAVATGFGGGLGNHQGICGALSGAVMILGLRYGSREAVDREAVSATYRLTQRLQEEFRGRFDTMICREILTKTSLPEAEKAQFFREYRHHEPCYRAVQAACEILDGILRPTP